MPSSYYIAMKQSMYHALATTACTLPPCESIKETLWKYVFFGIEKIIYRNKSADTYYCRHYIAFY